MIIIYTCNNCSIGTCHATNGPLKMGPPGPSVANYVAMDGPPDQVRLPWMVPRTICDAVSGPPLPQMVPLKLSSEMMSRGSYEVNLANMDRVIIIIIYFSLCIASCSS